MGWAMLPEALGLLHLLRTDPRTQKSTGGRDQLLVQPPTHLGWGRPLPSQSRHPSGPSRSSAALWTSGPPGRHVPNKIWSTPAPTRNAQLPPTLFPCVARHRSWGQSTQSEEGNPGQAHGVGGHRVRAQQEGHGGAGTWPLPGPPFLVLESQGLPD